MLATNIRRGGNVFGIRSYSNVGGVSGTALTIDKPAGVQQGDLLIAIMSGGAGTWTGDTGWTEISDLAAAPGLRAARKVAGASEASTYTFTHSVSSTLGGIILCVSKAAYDTAGAIVTSTGANAVVATGITSAGGIILAAYFKNLSGYTWSTPTGMEVVRQVTSNPSLSVFSENVAAGATGTRQSSPGGVAVGTNAGIIIGVKEA